MLRRHRVDEGGIGKSRHSDGGHWFVIELRQGCQALIEAVNEVGSRHEAARHHQTSLLAAELLVCSDLADSFLVTVSCSLPSTPRPDLRYQRRTWG